MSVFICGSCGHLEFNAAPEACPVCGGKNFAQNDKVFEESLANAKEGAAKHIPKIIVKKEFGCLTYET